MLPNLLPDAWDAHIKTYTPFLSLSYFLSHDAFIQSPSSFHLEIPANPELLSHSHNH